MDQDHPVLFQIGSAHLVSSVLLIYRNVNEKKGKTITDIDKASWIIVDKRTHRNQKVSQL